VSIDDYLQIGKENLDYMKAMLLGGKVQEITAEAVMAIARNTGAILGWIQKFVTGQWFGKKTDVEFKKGKEWSDVIDISREQLKLQKKMLDPNSKMNKKEIKAIQDQIDQLEQMRQERAKGYEYLIPDATAQALSEVRKQEQIGLDLTASGISEEDKTDLEKKQKEYATVLEKASKKIRDLKAIGYGQTEAEHRATQRTIERQITGDFVTNKKGYQYLQKGDLVIDAKSLARGMMGDRGEFVNKLNGFPGAGGGANEMGRLADAMISKMSQIGSAPQTPSINVPLSVTIGSLNGDTDDFLKKIGPAIEQTFNRMYFDKQKRK
jgi:hypothetical protein